MLQEVRFRVQARWQTGKPVLIEAPSLFGYRTSRGVPSLLLESAKQHLPAGGHHALTVKSPPSGLADEVELLHVSITSTKT